MPAPPPPTPGRLGLVDGLVLLSELVQKVFTRIASNHGLPPLQARLLGILRGRRPDMAELTRLLDLDTSSATGLVDRAQKRGLVERVTDPDDRRRLRVELTGEGRHTAAAFVAAITAELEVLTAPFPADDRGRLELLISELVTENASANGIDLTAELNGRGELPPTPPRPDEGADAAARSGRVR